MSRTEYAATVSGRVLRGIIRYPQAGIAVAEVMAVTQVTDVTIHRHFVTFVTYITLRWSRVHSLSAECHH